MWLLLQISFWLLVGLAPAISQATEPLPRSVLIIDQLESGTPFLVTFLSAFRSTVNANSTVPVSYYPEHLDFGRYRGPEYEELLRNYFRGKYREGSISVIVVNGTGALGYALRLRDELWPGVPLVFAGVEQNTSSLTNLPANVTGTTMRTTFRDAVAAAQSLVPGLERIALVGDPLERQPIRRHFLQELPVINAEVGVIDLTGLSMTELRKRVAALPERTAILYTAIYVDGAGVAYGPREAAALVAAAANRPMVIDRENLLGFGGTGGFLVGPAPIGEEAGRLVLRILGGESASEIPVTAGNFSRPIFDWRELKRWDISESRLPPGSEIRFREFNLWEQYRSLIIAALAVVLAQAAIIMWLYSERRRRRIAETALRQRLMEVVHLNRIATAATLSASIAHELSQPLGAIQSYAEAGELYLKSDPPNLERVEQILADILRDNQRAANVINHLRGLLKRRGEIELQKVDLNEVVRDALRILEPEALKRGVELNANRAEGPLSVRADQIHLEQVILNLAVNGMDAMQKCAAGIGKMSIQTALAGESTIEVSVTDSGTGVPVDKLNEVFDTFFTTKLQGTGLGLTIARTIIETYGGKIWAENRPGGGAVFRFTLPLAKVGAA